MAAREQTLNDKITELNLRVANLTEYCGEYRGLWLNKCREVRLIMRAMPADWPMETCLAQIRPRNSSPTPTGKLCIKGTHVCSPDNGRRPS
jgi:hypothetical protein